MRLHFDVNPKVLFPPRSGFVQRLRLDRASEASHDLNRLLDEPGPRALDVPYSKYLFEKRSGG
jgi:hypothetical protein